VAVVGTVAAGTAARIEAAIGIVAGIEGLGIAQSGTMMVGPLGLPIED
jgi:hypothetical protein